MHYFNGLSGYRFRNPKTGLVDIDLLYPCSEKEPCLLDRIIQEDNRLQDEKTVTKFW